MCYSNTSYWELIIIIIILYLHESEENCIEEDNAQYLDLYGEFEFLVKLIFAQFSKLFKSIYLRNTK